MGNYDEQWVAYFFGIADMAATQSKDPSTRVGAVIGSPNRLIVSTGYNGFPRGVKDDPEVLADRDARLRSTIHAEVNAILAAKRDLEGCSLFCTHPPCEPCANVIIQSGIRYVYALAPHADFLSRWGEELMRADRKMTRAGIETTWVRPGFVTENRRNPRPNR